MPDYKIKKGYSFHPGETLCGEDGTTYTIQAGLGRGGQGEVYKVRGGGGVYAVKWYHADTYLSKINREKFQNNLRKNVNNGIPKLSNGDTANQFIWPLKMIRDKAGSFGYLMQIFPEGYLPLRCIILGLYKDPATGKEVPVRWSSWFAKITAALNIVQAFEILHKAGFNYQDVNDGGFSVNPRDGSVFICDCDNVSPDKTNLGILGIKTFMAPEVVRGEMLPDRKTDEYSLAVLLFRMLLHGHPMIGQESRFLRSDPSRTDKEIDMMIYGTQPHYCLDSKRNRNPLDPAKDRDVMRNCLIYPMSLMQAFEQVFTEGVNDRNRRLNAGEWREVLTNVRDQLVVADGKEIFYGCWKSPSLPDDCRIMHYPNGTDVLCMPGKVLYDYHFNMYSLDFKKPVGKIIPTNRPGFIGLLNESGQDIHFILDGKPGICGNQHRIPLIKGMVLTVGKTKITIK